MQIIEINNNQREAWDAFVQAHPEGNIYQTWAWREMIQTVYRQQPLYLAITNDEGKIVAGLPLFKIRSKLTGNRLSSLPAAQFSNPLIRDLYDYEALVNYALAILEKDHGGYLEIKTSEGATAGAFDLAQLVNGYCCFTLNLKKSPEELQKQFHPSCVRRAIKKAVKNGLRLKTGASENDVRIFFDFYLKMRKTYGLIPQPLNFFIQMRNYLAPQERIQFLHAEFDGQIIASIILLKYKDRVIYEYGASDPAKAPLRPSPFLLWEAIKTSQSEGYSIFDFGRTSTENEGLMTFKERWGTQRLNLKYQYFPQLKGFGSARQSSLPKQIMYYSIKNSTPAIAHLMGKLFYRNLI